jgi:hypothetical protein
MKVPSSLTFRNWLYVPGKGFRPAFFYDPVVRWKEGRWAYSFRDNWAHFLFGRRYHRPKKKHIDRLEKQILAISPEWDGKGYEILCEDEPYIKFGTEYGLRMDPRDEDYGGSERREIWQNLRYHRPTYPCPLCGAEITFTHQRTKWAKQAAKVHKPECDLAIVSEIMEAGVETEEA